MHLGRASATLQVNVVDRPMPLTGWRGGQDCQGLLPNASPIGGGLKVSEAGAVVGEVMAEIRSDLGFVRCACVSQDEGEGDRKRESARGNCLMAALWRGAPATDRENHR